jgi:peroxin-7
MEKIENNNIPNNQQNNNLINNNQEISNRKFTTISSDFEFYSCKFSPFEPNLIAATCSQYYGMIGNGRLCVYNFDHSKQMITEIARLPTNNGCFDCAWSEVNQNIITTAQGDGTVKFWDINKKNDLLPIANLNSHAGEVYSVNWNIHQNNLLLSASHDMTIKLHDAGKITTINTFTGHQGVVYQAVWHPTIDGLFASCSSDNTFKIWDLKSGNVVKTIKAHNGHVMCCDFNKYDNTLGTGGSDGSFALWDLRGTTEVPLLALSGHSLSTKKVCFSPFNNQILATCGYDMNVRVWDVKNCQPVNMFKHHKEFVMGLDFSLFDQNLLASCGWDRTLAIYNWQK